MRAEGRKKPNYTHVTQSWCEQGRDVICCCVLVLMATLTREQVKFQERAAFLSAVKKKKKSAIFHSWLDLKAIKTDA